MSRPRSFDRARIEDAANAQGGVIAYRQLEELGMPKSSISRWTRTGGPWQRVLPGTYLLHRGTPTFDERLSAALLYTAPTNALSGSVGLHLHGLHYAPGPRDQLPVQVLVPMERQIKSSGFVIVERTIRMPEPITLHGYPVAPLARAAFDAARRLASRQEIRAFLLEAVQRRLITIDDLRAEVTNGQRRWTAILREVIGDARVGVRSVQEARLRDVIVNSDLPEPLWNPRLETLSGQFIAEPDGYYEEIGLALELDSRQHHFIDAQQFERTWTRHNTYNRYGIVAEHIIPSTLSANPQAVLADIRALLRRHEGRDAPEIRVIPADDVRKSS
ncbi:MAG TPA: hypothetical protein VFX15_00745 [Actinomycetes bacterium]|nr:hypothetical protein [Actinomycetes bacterium]